MKKYSIDEILISRNQGINTTTEKVVYSPCGYKIVQAKNIHKYKCSYDDENYIDSKTFERIKDIHKLNRGNVLFSNIGSQMGNACVYDSDEPAVITWNVLKMCPNTKIVDAHYLCFWFNWKAQEIRALNSSSTMPFVSGKVIGNLTISLPSIETQCKVSKLISSINKKIAINSEINQNLEAQAVLLFRSWFSSFSQSTRTERQDSEFGEIPVDYSVVKVGSLPMLVTDYVANGSFASLRENVNLYQEPSYAYFVRNTDLKSGSFGVYVDQHSYEFLSKSTLYGGEIIISNVGDVGSVFLCPKLDGPMTLGNNIIMLRPENDDLRYYLYIWFKYLQGQALIQGIKGGSAQPKFNKTDFKNTSILLPPASILSRFHETVSPVFELINQNQSENKRLSELRDTLLPKLMSGELDVSETDL